MALKSTSSQSTGRLGSGADADGRGERNLQGFRSCVEKRHKDLHALKVLIASESSFQHRTLRRLLKECGGQTVHVNTGAQVLDALATTTFVFAVVEDNYPMIDGPVTVALHGWCSVFTGTAATPVVLLCGNTAMARQMNCEEGDVLAIEPNASAIRRALISIGLLRKG